MKQENKGLLIRYLISFGVASVLTVGVFAIQGFFTDSPAVNMQILSDGFTISGLLLTLYAGMIFVSSQGATYSSDVVCAHGQSQARAVRRIP